MLRPGREDNFSLDDLLRDVQEDRETSFSFSERSTEPKTVADGWKLFERTPILKVHGSVNDPSSIILSHGGYKRLLHETVGYKNFMLSLMATNTILYMGFSFNDEYSSPLPNTPRFSAIVYSLLTTAFLSQPLQIPQ